MTNTPIRANIYVAAEKPAADPTLRQLVEWSKTAARAVDDPSAQEVAYIQSVWLEMIAEKAEKEGIPAGHLSYMLQELHLAEERLVQQAMSDAVGGNV